MFADVGLRESFTFGGNLYAYFRSRLFLSVLSNIELIFMMHRIHSQHKNNSQAKKKKNSIHQKVRFYYCYRWAIIKLFSRMVMIKFWNLKIKLNRSETFFNKQNLKMLRYTFEKRIGLMLFEKKIFFFRFFQWKRILQGECTYESSVRNFGRQVTWFRVSLTEETVKEMAKIVGALHR